MNSSVQSPLVGDIFFWIATTFLGKGMVELIQIYSYLVK